MNKRSATESRKKILDSAVKAFSEYGYKGASMRIISRTAGISLGAPYLYFRNKEELYATLIKKQLDDLADKTEKLLKNVREPDEALTAFIAMRLNYARRHKELILIQAEEYGLGLGMRETKDFLRRQRKIVEDIIRKGTESGRFRRCDEREVAKIIICLLRGFILSIVIEPGALFPHDVCVDIILHGLLSAKKLKHHRKSEGVKC